MGFALLLLLQSSSSAWPWLVGGGQVCQTGSNTASNTNTNTRRPLSLMDRMMGPRSGRFQTGGAGFGRSSGSSQQARTRSGLYGIAGHDGDANRSSSCSSNGGSSRVTIAAVKPKVGTGGGSYTGSCACGNGSSGSNTRCDDCWLPDRIDCIGCLPASRCVPWVRHGVALRPPQQQLTRRTRRCPGQDGGALQAGAGESRLLLDC